LFGYIQTYQERYEQNDSYARTIMQPLQADGEYEGTAIKTIEVKRGGQLHESKKILGQLEAQGPVYLVVGYRPNRT